MENHYTLSDEVFEKQFADASLNPSLFSHEAHLRLAWIHLRKYGEAVAIQNVCRQIQQFDRTHGDGTKFHKTLTVAAIKAVHHFLNHSQTTDFQSFIAENQRLKTKFKELIKAHYALDIFGSEQAKAEFVEPDLLPFD